MSLKNSLFGALYLSILLAMYACSTTEEMAAEGSTSNDAERLHRIDSLSAVKADTSLIQQSFRQPETKPATRKDDK
ncbi:MAG: hypothetical protein A3D92_03440 [Bacteroidetes bacterium RIFCSPHIGHO2_02_FULL_44_7]|nr:MAG: hypothetical protein A3D92_03440 [Bacteroidetes bacterium RIFCSPHIGHO2_02_FULL_44_7]